MRRKLISGVAFALVLCVPPLNHAESTLETEDEKVLYTLGVALSQKLVGFGFTETELATIQSGLLDGVLGRTPKVELQVYGPKIDGMMSTRYAAAATVEADQSALFLIDAAKAEGAVVTDTGMIYVEHSAGTGVMPLITDTVRIQ